jgi:hypothetical protein
MTESTQTNITLAIEGWLHLTLNLLVMHLFALDICALFNRLTHSFSLSLSDLGNHPSLLQPFPSLFTICFACSNDRRLFYFSYTAGYCVARTVLYLHTVT